MVAPPWKQDAWQPTDRCCASKPQPAPDLPAQHVVPLTRKAVPLPRPLTLSRSTFTLWMLGKSACTNTNNTIATPHTRLVYVAPLTLALHGAAKHCYWPTMYAHSINAPPDTVPLVTQTFTLFLLART